MRNFILFSAICCFLTVISTIIIHSIPYVELTFNERLLLYKDVSYNLHRILIIAHCFFVIVTVFGFLFVQKTKSITFSSLGVFCFLIFAITEIARQVLVLFYLNGLKEKYLATDSDTIKEIIKVNIENFGYINFLLYTIFIVSFSLGALFCSFSLFYKTASIYDKTIGYLFLVWSVGTFLSFGNVFWENPELSKMVHILNNYFQPIIRFMLAIWLWNKSSELIRKKQLSFA